ncbi:TenA family protein [Streptosporangium roseum]|uniref:Transcriptional activator, TenA family n=1 Tax=Streptosporangium roseum (strain ATCC 12428 / DSM 43021 / JCM 3005 / KCTC 9067 / NCIMB 10171 / NRRL 2505 / NI 9100) TaxID=479432 RepID=D2AY71_STRRD|nr:TenA family transcriptional regulator [Streptosporangium roseum]ACZ87081.1 putative transcriptional activator, TenA family [Streptosporangium roseum DSM 43021]
MLQEELMEIRDPLLRKVQDHPFWSGLRDGSLPGEALARFVQQDTGFLLPAYARALARCAAAAPDDADTLLLGQSVVGTLTARDRLRRAYTTLAGELGLPELQAGLPADPATQAHASFFAAASARSFYAGVGALLPMVWFNAEVSDNLRRDAAPGSRYLPWIEVYHPGDSYGYAVRAFLDMVDRAGESCSARERQLIVEQFSISVRYEWAFAECCIRQPSWPV